jgi:long-chain acyl-CoA synthetase
MMTLDRMLERATQSNPSRLAIIARDGKLTYQQLNNQVNAFANGLLQMGLQRGDRVALLLPKSIEAVVCFLGVARAGGIIAPINMRLKSDALIAHFNQIKAFAVIADPLYLTLLEKFYRPNQPQGRIILTSISRHENVASYEHIISTEPETAPDIPTKVDDVVYLNYTSGTTGLPKGAVTTHGNLFWNTKGAVDMLKMTGEDVHLCMFPVYAHPHEIFCRSIYLGGTTVLLDSMYPKTISRVIQEYGVTCVMAVPPFFKSLFLMAKNREFDFSSVRIAESGGVHSPAEFCRDYEEIFQHRFLPVWGSTETTGIALCTPPEGDYKLGTLGKPCPGYNVRVIGAGGREAGPDETGELVISGPGVVQGYYNLREDTDMTFHNKVLYTGDMVSRDADGFLQFLGRRSGLMKVAGLKVYPLEVENVLMQHPAVDEAAVVALPDALRGEVPKAFVVLKPTLTADAKEIREFCRERLADYKLPAYIEIRSELPKSESGKISHTALTQEALDDLAEDEIKSIQRRIYATDSKILDLLNMRVELVQRILKLRGHLDHRLHSALRGDEVIARVIAENKGPIYDEAVEEIFKKILALDLIIQL